MSSNIAEYKASDEFWRNEKLPAINREGLTENGDVIDKLIKNPPSQGKREYEENIKHTAGKIYLPKDLLENEITEIIPGRAWVIPNVLSEEECADWVARGEAAGLKKPDARSGTIRTASRTSHYEDTNMSSTVKQKLTDTLISNIEKSAPGSAYRGIHDNWKIARYEKGDAFPAHFDQDSYQTLPPNKDGIKVEK